MKRMDGMGWDGKERNAAGQTMYHQHVRVSAFVFLFYCLSVCIAFSKPCIHEHTSLIL